jgi:hypothetical protein
MWVDYSKVSKTSSYDLRHAATGALDWICIYYCETMVPQSEAVRRLIPHIELEIMPKAGHLHNVDQRDCQLKDTEIPDKIVIKLGS